MRAKKTSAFTLVEILIVVVILGILAAIVIPQFSGASLEARESSLESNLQGVRSQIELYKIQHLENLPGSTAGVTFTQALTEKTDIYGELWLAADQGTAYGPYMKTIPVNAFSDKYDAATGNGTVESEAGTGSLGGANCSWHFDTDTGDFRADDDETNADGRDHTAL